MSDDRLAELGQRIREIRRTRGLTQQVLADRAGLDRAYVGQVERGKANISVRNLFRIGDALAVGAAAFFSQPSQ